MYDVKSIVEKYKEKYYDIKLHIFKAENKIKIDLIVIPEYIRNEGIGTKIINDIIDYAKANGVTLELTPAIQKEDIKKWGIKKEKLLKFWKNMGFVENKGRNKDYEISASFYMKTKYIKEKKELFELLNETIDLRLIEDFSFESFYKQYKKENEINIEKYIAKKIIENKNEYNINELDETNIVERIGDFRTFKKVGSGSDRDVYDIGEGYVIKVAKNTRGITQNENESAIASDGFIEGLVPNIIEEGKDYIIVEKCIRYSDLNKEEKKRINKKLKELKKFSQKDWEEKAERLQNALREQELEDLMNYDLLWNDFTASRNWGIDKGNNIIMLDGGTIGDPDFINEKQNKINRQNTIFDKKKKNFIKKYNKKINFKNK